MRAWIRETERPVTVATSNRTVPTTHAGIHDGEPPAAHGSRPFYRRHLRRRNSEPFDGDAAEPAEVAVLRENPVHARFPAQGDDLGVEHEVAPGADFGNSVREKLGILLRGKEHFHAGRFHQQTERAACFLGRKGLREQPRVGHHPQELSQAEHRHAPAALAREPAEPAARRPVFRQIGDVGIYEDVGVYGDQESSSMRS